MSVLNGISTPDFLMGRLEKIKNDIIVEKNINIYKNNALLIENFLNKIIGNQINKDNIIDGLTQEYYDKALKELGINIEHWTKKKTDAYGVKFESFLQNLLSDIFKHSKDKEIANWTGGHVTSLGLKTVNPLKNITDKTIDDTTKNLMESAYKEIAKELDKQSKESEIKNHTMNKVQGKIDTISHHINFEISTEDPLLQKVLPLLANASFSDKAYKNSGDVKIGQTNSFRVFLAISGDMDAQEKINRWNRMLNCMDFHPNDKAAEIFYELRYIYELTGYGLQYSKQAINRILGNDTGADYLIYFHKGKIKVLSTAAIINDFLSNVKDTAKGRTLSNGEITKEYALYARLKMRMIGGRFKIGEL